MAKNIKEVIQKISIIFIMLLILIFTYNTAIINAQSSEQRILINEIKFNQSEILSKDEIKAITVKYEGKKLTVSEMRGIVEEINQIYNKRGFITARAILPAQEVENGILKLKLIEGKIGEINISGNKETKDSYILKRLAFQRGDIIQIDELENELFYFNATSDLNVQVELKAGKAYATTDLHLQINEPKKYNFSIFTDNGGSKETGIIRYGFNFANSSLRGCRDKLSLSLFETAGAFSGGLNYTVLLNTRGGQVSVGYNKSYTDIIAGEYKELNIEGDYEEYSLNLSHPIKVEPGQIKEGFFRYKTKNSDTYFSGTNLLNDDVQTYSLGLHMQKVNPKVTWVSEVEILKGYAVSGKGSFTDPGTIQDFIKYKANIENQRYINKGDLFTFKFDLQLTNNKLLPSSEQYSLGGVSSIRGFKSGKLSGDKGFYFNLELKSKVNNKINNYVFLDHGAVYPYKGNEEQINKEDFITSAGIGLDINFTKSLKADFVLGLPLEVGNKPKLHFNIQKSW